MAVCAIVVALLGVSASFAVAIYYGATAQREFPPMVPPDTFTQHMCACRSLTFERNVSQAELSNTTPKVERNPSINPSRKRAVNSAK